MANKKVTQFNPVTDIENTDLIPLIRSSEPDPSLKNSYITGANFRTQINYPQVANYSALPTPASSYSGQIYVVLNGEGIYLINRKDAGLYYSDGANWVRLGNVPAYFSDANFRVYNSIDTSKQAQMDVSAVSTATTRTITMPDANVTLHDPVTVSDTSTIDLTLSGQQISADVNNSSITYAKIQNVSATDRLLGRDTAGSGVVEELTASGGIEFTGTGIQRSALTGDVTASAGSNATTIANNAVTLAKMTTIATDSILGRATAATGNVEVLTALPFAYTGDVTRPADSNTTTIANNAVTLAKMATIATDSILGRATVATGNVEVLTALPFAYTGDVTRPADSNVTTIANNAVTNAKSAQMAANTIKSNATAGTADPSDLAVGTNTVVGRVAGNIVASQLVNDQITNATIDPTTKLSSTGTPSATTYLRGDNTWSTIAGGGDVTGPASSTDNFVALYNGATGKIIKNSTIDGAWFNQGVATTSSPSFTALTVSAGNLTVNRTGTGLTIGFVNATDNTVDINLTNSISTTRLRKNSINGDFLIAVGGTNFVTIGGNLTSGSALNITQSSVVFNEDGVDRDFRVESDTDPNTLVADGGTGNVGIGILAPSEKLEINGNVKSSGYVNLDAISDPSAPASGDSRLYAFTQVNRTCLRMMCDEGMAADIQPSFYNRAIMLVGITNGTTNPSTVNCNGSFTATLSYQHTIASANPWLATRRKRHTTSTVAGNQSGYRIAYAVCYRGNAAGYGGFFFVKRFGHNLNLNGSQCFIGLSALTTALPATAGAVSALVDMIGVGYDTTDSSAGNWQFFRNDGSGSAVKVDLGSSALRSNVSHGYELMIFLGANSGTYYVKITNIHDGTVLLNTSYTTDVPTANVGLCVKCECNNGAVAAATDIDYSMMYLATGY